MSSLMSSGSVNLFVLYAGDQESVISEVCREHLQQWLSSGLEHSLLSSLRRNLQAGSAEASTPQSQDGALPSIALVSAQVVGTKAVTSFKGAARFWL